jgi:signal transduction histidine kinase
LKNKPKIVNRINASIPLPSLPQILFKLIDVCKNDADNLEEIVRVISLDPALSLKLMRFASAWQSQAPDTRSFDRIVQLLGPGNIRKVALAALMEPLIKPVMKNAVPAFNRFWLHSVSCAITTRKLSQELETGHSGDAYLSGLLHDIGKLVLLMNHPREYAPVFFEQSSGSQLVKEEDRRIGTTHCEAGWLAVRSNSAMPFIADGVLYHHQPVADIVNAFPPLKIIYAANIMSHHNTGTARLSEMTASIGLKLTQQQMENIFTEVKQQVTAIIAFLGLNPNEFKPVDQLKPADGAPTSPIYEFLEEIRDSTLAQTVTAGRDSGEDKKAVQKELAISLQSLFDTVSAFFFYLNPADKVLVGSPTQDYPRDIFADTLQLPYNPGSNLPSTALQQGEAIDSFGLLTQVSVNIGDKQLIDLLDAEGVICLPLVAGEKRIGVIAAGINEVQIPILSELLPLVKRFAEFAVTRLQPFMESDEHPAAPPVSIKGETKDKIDPQSLRRIIHEVNNPLSIIKNYLRVLASKVEDKIETDEEIGLIRDEISRIPAIIKQLAGGAEGKSDRNGEQVDINTVVSDLSRLLSSAVLDQSKISLHFDPETQLPPFKGAKYDINQVLINILKNAVEAMPGGGNIFIKTGFQPSNRNGAADSIVISIRDDGPGIPDKIMTRLFEPGNTSKGSDNFGLGLSISKDVVKRYNGLISCESRLHEGTTFTIKLPI